jgi:hypothetical protein
MAAAQPAGLGKPLNECKLAECRLQLIFKNFPMGWQCSVCVVMASEELSMLPLREKQS